jgi:nitroreductase
MTDRLRVILEIGPKRRIVAGAMDWPGLDRWGSSEDAVLEKLATYLPRYAGVVERAGLADSFASVDGCRPANSAKSWGRTIRMDIHEALYTTRAMRRLRPDPIPLDAQARILDAAIRAPNIGQEWRFILVDDRELMARLAPLYERAWTQMFDAFGADRAQMVTMNGPMGRAARSGDHLARHFAEVPLLLLAFGKTRDGSGVYPAVWSAMLAARAEGIGSTLTGVLQTFAADEVFEVLRVPKDEGWFMHGAVPLGYPTGKWGVAPRKPVHEVAARNGWEGELGFTVDEPLWTASGPGRS